MASGMVKRLRDRLRTVEAERDKLAQLADALHRVIADFEGTEGELEATASTPKTLANELWRVLEDEGEPRHYTMLYERLRQRGVEVAGKDPLRNVGAHLSLDPRFISLGRGVWALKSWQKAKQAHEGGNGRGLGDQQWRDSSDNSEPSPPGFPRELQEALAALGNEPTSRDESDPDDLPDLPF